MIDGRLTTRNNDDDGTDPCFTCDRAPPSHTQQELLLQWCKTQVYNFKTTQPATTTTVVHIGVSRVTELLCHLHHKRYSCNVAKHKLTTMPPVHICLPLPEAHTISPHSRTWCPRTGHSRCQICVDIKPPSIIPCTGGGNGGRRQWRPVASASNCGSGKCGGGSGNGDGSGSGSSGGGGNNKEDGCSSNGGNNDVSNCRHCTASYTGASAAKSNNISNNSAVPRHVMTV